MKYRVYNLKDFERLLKKNGYEPERQTGSHIIWVKQGRPHIAVPKSCNPMVLRRLIKEHNLIE